MLSADNKGRTSRQSAWYSVTLPSPLAQQVAALDPKDALFMGSAMFGVSVACSMSFLSLGQVSLALAATISSMRRFCSSMRANCSAWVVIVVLFRLWIVFPVVVPVFWRQAVVTPLLQHVHGCLIVN